MADNPVTTDTKSKGASGCLWAFIGVAGTLGFIALAFLGCVAYLGTSINDIQQESEGMAEIKDTSWVPAGFSAYNNDVAMKWSDSGSFTCSYGQRCIQMEVVSKEGCNSLYAELSKIDASGNNVGYTNETTSGLAPGQKALMLFNTFGDFESFSINKISCL